MSVDWESIPLLSLKCILDHLSMKDALAAMSTCHHWRHALLMCEGHKEMLALRASQQEKNLFVAKLYRKNVKRLHIYVDCGENALNEFMINVMPLFFDTIEMKEVMFIRPIYKKRNALLKLNKKITESFVYKHSNTLRKFAVIGLKTAIMEYEEDKYIHDNVELYSRHLTFANETLPEDTILSKSNVNIMSYSSLKHLVFDYDLISQETLYTLSALKNLKMISLNVTYRKNLTFPTVDWNDVNTKFANRINVAVNVINMPTSEWPDLEPVFARNMPVTSLKFMFCKTIDGSMIVRVASLYKETLQEFVWVDAPHEGPERSRHISTELEMEGELYFELNPFVLMCWQCTHLRRLTIHGYWIWQYDLIGFARLRKDLVIEVSAMYPGYYGYGKKLQDNIIQRVMAYDLIPCMENDGLTKKLDVLGCEWIPFLKMQLPHALRGDSSSPDSRAVYIASEVLSPFGIT